MLNLLIQVFSFIGWSVLLFKKFVKSRIKKPGKKMRILRDIEDTELSTLSEGETFYHGGILYLKIRPVRNIDNIIVNAINLDHAHPIRFGENIKVKPISTHIVVEE